MKLASYFHRQSYRHSYGIVNEHGIVDLDKYLGEECQDLKSALSEHSLCYLAKYQSCPNDYNLDDVVFQPVIENPGKIFCVGMNYREKCIEFDAKESAPTLFIRFPDSLTGHGCPLVKPQTTAEFDYEGELAVIIGKHAFHVPEQDALSYVAGYSCFMDGSVRDMQYSWFTSGKNWLRTGGFGPWMVTADEIQDPQTLSIATFLNGLRVQNDNTSHMLHSVAELIAYISAFSPLSPGDVIITGSPGGVGKKRTPPLFMKNGDIIEVEIGGVGRLSNVVVEQEIKQSSVISV